MKTKDFADIIRNQIETMLEGGYTPGEVASELGLDVYGEGNGACVALPGYVADDGNADVEYDWATTGAEAAREYVDDGSWGDIEQTCWVHVHTWRVALSVQDGEVTEERVEESTHRVDLNPDEPECTESAHDWQSPYEILGGLRENPGVHGHGGGVIVTECCMHCGCARVTDTWAQDREDGAQGLESVRYEPGEYSEEVASLRDDVANMAEDGAR